MRISLKTTMLIFTFPHEPRRCPHIYRYCTDTVAVSHLQVQYVEYTRSRGERGVLNHFSQKKIVNNSTHEIKIMIQFLVLMTNYKTHMKMSQLFLLYINKKM